MKKIVSCTLVMILIVGLCMFPVSSAEYITWQDQEIRLTGSNKYAEKVLPLVYTSEEVEFYGEIYEWCAEGDCETVDEATPDYVLINTATNMVLPMPVADVYGDYVFCNYSINRPFKYCYCIYLTESGEVIGLTDALENEVEGIYNVFTQGGIGDLIGDMDKDRKLTVRDATYIQKCIAGLEKFEYYDKIEAFEADLRQGKNPPLLYISDFTRDYERNIKDATAIQKHIAGLEY